MQYDTGLRSVLPQAINVFMLILIALLGYRLNGAVLAFLVSRILTAIMGMYVLCRIFPAISSKLKAVYEVPKLVKFSLPLMVADVAKWLLTRIDRLMLGSMRSSSAVGIYNAGALTASYTFFILRSLGDSFSPTISTLYSSGKEEQLGQLFQTVTRWIFALSLPITLILILFSKDIILLFGPDFETGSQILVIHSIAYLIAAGVGPVGFMLIMSGRQNIELLNTFAVVGLNTMLNFWLIRLYGGIGAAIATGISISLVNMIRLLEVMVIMKMQPFNRKYVKPLLAGLIMILISMLLNFVPSIGFIWVFYSGILVLIYGGLLYFMGFEEEDRAIFSMVKNKVKSISS
jgi:O-antigen/teichoic acid export membrane protein